MAPIVLTGCAGFIGSHVARRLLRDGHEVSGLDNLNDYYDPSLKRARLALLAPERGFRFTAADVADREALDAVLDEAEPEYVVHLAAQVGVRNSVRNPRAYAETNLDGFFNVLDGCARRGVRHLVYASSSSVYGSNEKVPFSEEDPVDHPISFYAATKKANEIMAHAYSHLNRLPTTGLRFFTVYGPWGRPDMAPILFGRAILRGEPITLFNHGRMLRDFTYVDDVVEVVTALVPRPPEPEDAAPYRVLNVGNDRPVALEEFVAILERHLGRPALRKYAPMQPGDVPATWADVRRLQATVGFVPRTPIEEGLRRMTEWLVAYDGDARKGAHAG
ncbi:NAD-dependent epimerase/dehydratase family protein [Anaeromyxobacter sp. Fw109-5]|uniref:NAD-dependent epimerase/dehydratase family protein n=1 Tax=Anaeromyxobacter sp. (strain Fw109-5) TaxID=404589 RepID=UPI000308EFD6|nr:NAD-dependent epimerase/dehydratase family protein [Anaeromyxobacter sp. Fw109-5]